jgi:DNA modification methylase
VDAEQGVKTASGKSYVLYNQDCVVGMQAMPDKSVDFNIHSPPFAALYIYSDSEADMGNSASDEEFFRHYRFAIDEMFRLCVPGRLVAVHCKDLPKYANVYGTTGLIDFPGACIQEFEAAGFVYHSRVTIWKCPVIERERTNNNGLLHKTVQRDTSQVRQGMADYLLVFRRPPEDGTLMSEKPIVRPKGFERYIGLADPRSGAPHPSKYARTGDTRESIAIWQRYADPVWWDIDQTNVLNYQQARSEQDERHICPLQLDVISRAIHIWSDVGDVVLSPFTGIGSEGVMALRLERKFVGFELKESYFEIAARNLAAEERELLTPTLFDSDPDWSVRKHCEFGGFAVPAAERRKAD